MSILDRIDGFLTNRAPGLPSEYDRIYKAKFPGRRKRPYNRRCGEKRLTPSASPNPPVKSTPQIERKRTNRYPPLRFQGGYLPRSLHSDAPPNRAYMGGRRGPIRSWVWMVRLRAFPDWHANKHIAHGGAKTSSVELTALSWSRCPAQSKGSSSDRYGQTSQRNSGEI